MQKISTTQNGPSCSRKIRSWEQD